MHTYSFEKVAVRSKLVARWKGSAIVLTKIVLPRSDWQKISGVQKVFSHQNGSPGNIFRVSKKVLIRERFWWFRKRRGLSLTNMSTFFNLFEYFLFAYVPTRKLNWILRGGKNFRPTPRESPGTYNLLVFGVGMAKFGATMGYDGLLLHFVF